MISLKALQDEVLGVARDILPSWLMEFHIFLADVLIDFLDISAVKRSEARK